MDLTNKQVIQALLIRHKISPKKSFGQHFLIDQLVLEKIIAAAKLEKVDRSRTILEIGPGLGALTGELLKRTGKVISVEADHQLAAILKQIVGKRSNLTVVPAAIQHFRRQEYLLDQKFDLVANLPFNISSYVLRTFLELVPRPRQIIVLIQKEVAERVIAKAGDSERGLLSLAVELFAKNAEVVQIVPPSAFWPEPKVESAILKIDVRASGHSLLYRTILPIAKICFNQRRKKIKNSLPTEITARLTEKQIDPNLRPQDLTLKQWKTISTLSPHQSEISKI